MSTTTSLGNAHLRQLVGPAEHEPELLRGLVKLCASSLSVVAQSGEEERSVDSCSRVSQRRQNARFQRQQRHDVLSELQEQRRGQRSLCFFFVERPCQLS